MEKTKIYLAKSNRSNPDDVSRVRQVLSEFVDEIEVVEFKGGSYSHKDMLKCDLLVVVPDLTDFDVRVEDAISIGKGLHEQIDAFTCNHPNEYDILIVYETDSKSVSITKIECVDGVDTDDYVNYSSIFIDQEGAGDLTSFIENHFGLEKTDSKSSSESNYKYLVIGKIVL